MITKAVKDLRESDQFKFIGKRKFWNFKKFVELSNSPGMPVHHRGKHLIIVDDCKQFVCDKDLQVEVKEVQS